jgi:hypothetical protein
MKIDAERYAKEECPKISMSLTQTVTKDPNELNQLKAAIKGGTALQKQTKIDYRYGGDQAGRTLLSEAEVDCKGGKSYGGQYGAVYCSINCTIPVDKKAQ